MIGEVLQSVMAYPTLSLKHIPLTREERCANCSADFVPAEDSGSRVLAMEGEADSYKALLCGGCYSKWTHGTVVTVRTRLTV